MQGGLSQEQGLCSQLASKAGLWASPSGDQRPSRCPVGAEAAGMLANGEVATRPTSRA